MFIPAWNEAGALPELLEEAGRDLPGAELLVIDDGSTDDTAAVARAGGAQVVSFGENRGLRVGIAEGYRQAAERGYRYCGRLDADGQHPPAELARMLDLLRADECDVAVGSRFLPGSGEDGVKYQPAPERVLGTTLLRLLMRVRLGQPFTDATSGLYAVNDKALALLSDPYVCESPEVEALIRIRDARLRLLEVPVHMRQREHGDLVVQRQARGDARAQHRRDARGRGVAAAPAQEAERPQAPAPEERLISHEPSSSPALPASSTRSCAYSCPANGHSSGVLPSTASRSTCESSPPNTAQP